MHPLMINNVFKVFLAGCVVQLQSIYKYINTAKRHSALCTRFCINKVYIMGKGQQSI